MNSADDPIYLDYNATTPLLPEVVHAMLPYLQEHFGNPSSRHLYGRRTHDAIERARSELAALINSHADEIIFTSGGTEANNLAIRGTTARASRRRIVTSTIEHPATARPVSWREQQGWDIVRVGVDTGGRAEVRELDAAITSATTLVTIMHSNNETGVFQPIQEAVRFARRAGALVHTDAAQSVGKVPIDVRAMDVDLLSIAGHKLYGPKGVGALFVRRGTGLEPMTLGAGHERGLRPGTENVASIVGLGAACAVAQHDLDVQGARVRALRDRLWEQLAQAIPHLALNGHVEHRLPNRSMSAFLGFLARRFSPRPRRSLRLPGLHATTVTSRLPLFCWRWVSRLRPRWAQSGSRWDAPRPSPRSTAPPPRLRALGAHLCSNSLGIDDDSDKR